VRQADARPDDVDESAGRQPEIELEERSGGGLPPLLQRAEMYG